MTAYTAEQLERARALRDSLGGTVIDANRDAIKIATALAAERARAIEEAADFCETGCVQIGCTGGEADGVVRRTRDALANGLRALSQPGGST